MIIRRAYATFNIQHEYEHELGTRPAAEVRVGDGCADDDVRARTAGAADAVMLLNERKIISEALLCAEAFCSN
eukprot:scaffold82786_cov41-Prasinocladus_malaysianus.AAC.1